MKIITFDDIKNLNISPVTCYEWVEDMLLNKKKVVLPPKISMKWTDGVFCNVMPCELMDERNSAGVKVVTRYPERIPSLDSDLVIFDSETGEFLAFMDANWITAMRTGAVAAHSIKLLAKKGFSKLSFLGLGNTARAALLVLASIMPEKQFTVKLMRFQGEEDSFAERFRDFSNLKFEYADTHEDLVRGCEVLVSAATYLPEDVCPDDCFDEGVLVVPIHTLGFTNCDLFFDKIYADDFGHVHHFKNFDKFKYFSEVTDVLLGNTKGRENDRERILAYNIGLSIHDINFASRIYAMLCDNEKIKDVDMCAPKDKFWI